MKYIFLFSFLLLIGCKKNNTDNNFNKSTVTYKQQTGINSNLFSMDIYYNNNTSQKKPIVVYVHGGGWCIGDKINQVDHKINLFHSLNYVFISINYRLSPFPYQPNNQNRIKYPDHNNDIADALLWIYQNIENYGGDKNKIVIMGHSAGAHLVALTGTNKNFLENVGLNLNSIKGVAVIDTEGFDIIEHTNSGSLQDLYINAFGTNTNLNRDASPLYNIDNQTIYPKFFIAKRGNSQRIAYADAFINKLETNGVNVSQVNGSIYDHSGINDAIGKDNEILITNALKSFLANCFQ